MVSARDALGRGPSGNVVERFIGMAETNMILSTALYVWNVKACADLTVLWKLS